LAITSFRGGFSVEFVGFQMKYDTKEVGVSLRRGDWLRDWIVAASERRYVVVTRDFAEFLGRLGFVAQLLVWMKPYLSPLYAWSAATISSTVAKLPDTVFLTLKYILAELRWSHTWCCEYSGLILTNLVRDEFVVFAVIVAVVRH
jgi:hypothetical protein